MLGAGTAKPARPTGNLGSDIACVQPGYDDASWRTLNLPHDWAIEGPFSQDLPGDTGKLPFASPGWYRKHFTTAAGDAGRRLTLEIDGAIHDGQHERDHERTLALEGVGYTIVRWTNDDVELRLVQRLAELRRCLDAVSPLPRTGEGQG